MTRWAANVVLWIVLGAVLSASGAVAQATGGAPGVGVRLGGDMTSTRVVIDSPAALSGRPAAGGAGQVVFSLTGQARIPSLQGRGLALVKAWRLEAGPAGSRLVLDLASEGVVRRRFMIPPAEAGGPYRYVIDIAPPSPVAQIVPAPVRIAETEPAPTFVETTVAPAPRPRPTPETGRTSSRHTRKVVVIDAGHGGHDPGALSDAASEKDLTLAAALSLRARLERTGRYKVVMTRSSDVFIPLDARVQIARRAGADLFIALHADSAGAESGPHGASVYTLSDHGETRVGEVLGHDEWFTHAGARNDPGVGRILLDLTQRSTKNRSAIFASLLVDRLSDKIELLPRSHRDAGYFVLLAPDVPAVLLEMGFISNPDDEARLADPIQRRALMDVVADAIDAYFDTQTELAQG